MLENRPDWYRMVENLLISLRMYGGRLATARFVAHVVGGIDERAARVLRDLGAELKPVDGYFTGRPTTNKLRMFLDFVESSSEGVLIGLDCDTVIVGDILDELSSTTVRAMPAGSSPMTDAQWNELLAGLGLPRASTPTIMLETREQVPAPYLNSGVMFVPGAVAAALTESWVAHVDEFAAQMERGVDAPWTGYMLDQVALACALLETRLDVSPLPPTLNLPTAVKLDGRLEPDQLAAVGLLHYHRHRTDEELLKSTDSPEVNAMIDQINEIVVARTGRRRLRHNEGRAGWWPRPLSRTGR